MRKFLYRLGWAILFALPVVYVAQVYWFQDLPRVEPWKWLLLFVVVAIIYFARDRDDVLKHHVVG